MTEEDKQPWLSIVTVVKDDPTGFDRTRESILNQSNGDYEWIVVDSSDVELIVPDANVYTWTAPTGVFPAMNTGLRLCTGQRVLFLNAGDTLNGKTTLSEIQRACSSLEESTIIYGDVSFISEDGLKNVTPPPFDFEFERARLFSAGRFPPHQGLVAPRESLNKIGGFDESYKVAGDYKTTLLLSVLARFEYLPLVITRFTLGGVSSQSWVYSLREFHTARVQVYNLTGFRRIKSWWAMYVQLCKMTAARVWETHRS